MLAGSFEMTLGWYELQEASRGSDLGKEKQEAHHIPGFSFEDGHHTQSVPGPLGVYVLLSLVLQNESARME